MMPLVMAGELLAALATSTPPAARAVAATPAMTSAVRRAFWAFPLLDIAASSCCPCLCECARRLPPTGALSYSSRSRTECGARGKGASGRVPAVDADVVVIEPPEECHLLHVISGATVE